MVFGGLVPSVADSSGYREVLSGVVVGVTPLGMYVSVLGEVSGGRVRRVVDEVLSSSGNDSCF